MIILEIKKLTCIRWNVNETCMPGSFIKSTHRCIISPSIKKDSEKIILNISIEVIFIDSINNVTLIDSAYNTQYHILPLKNMTYDINELYKQIRRLYEELKEHLNTNISVNTICIEPPLIFDSYLENVTQEIYSLL